MVNIVLLERMVKGYFEEMFRYAKLDRFLALNILGLYMKAQSILISDDTLSSKQNRLETMFDQCNGKIDSMLNSMNMTSWMVPTTQVIDDLVKCANVVGQFTSLLDYDKYMSKALPPLKE